MSRSSCQGQGHRSKNAYLCVRFNFKFHVTFNVRIISTIVCSSCKWQAYLSYSKPCFWYTCTSLQWIARSCLSMKVIESRSQEQIIIIKFQRISIVLCCIPLLYKLTERNLYYIQVALPTWCIYKVHVLIQNVKFSPLSRGFPSWDDTTRNHSNLFLILVLTPGIFTSAGGGYKNNNNS